jgi:signal transduction histidine kinase
MKFWHRLKLDTLYARIAGVMILNLLLVQFITFSLVRLEVEHVPLRTDLAERIATSLRILEILPAEQRGAVAAGISTPELRITLQPSFDGSGARTPIAQISPRAQGLDLQPETPTSRFEQRIIERLDPEIPRQVAIVDHTPGAKSSSEAEDQSLELRISIPDGSMAVFLIQRVPTPFRWLQLATQFASICVVSAVLTLWFAGRFSRRLAEFANAAEELGRSAEAPPLPEAGPDELRLATRAFNRMQERLRRFVHDRTQMLAAISHDLRTPLTRMRLRAEFVEADEQREKMLHDIAEMEAMISATLAFARDDVTREPREEEDLDEMLDHICEAMREAGQDARYEAIGPVTIKCAPVALRRAFANLFQNAVKYGQRVRARLARVNGHLVIEIDDDGPGIPRDQQETVFQPFFRLDSSRNRDTGGVGLGLSVARTIIRGHGGDVTLFNRPAGGLRVTVMMPA